MPLLSHPSPQPDGTAVFRGQNIDEIADVAVLRQAYKHVLAALEAERRWTHTVHATERAFARTLDRP